MSGGGCGKLIAMTTLVTGATGTLGRVVVRQLRDAGRPARVLSRRPAPPDGDPDWVTGDLATGAGLVSAVDGATTVIHCATDGRRPGADLGAVHQLLAALRDHDTHLLYVSIVGVDRVPLRYYREKYAVEQVIERSDVPWTVLRATQFHDLLATLLRVAARLPVVPVPGGTSFQPIDVPEVAAHLIDLVKGGPAGRAPDLGGPQVRSASDLARVYVRSRGLRRRVLPVRLPGRIAHALRAGGNLAPENAGGGRTWEEFLAS
jgi:uncharacterized protein YbjT (DUF2867 family)